MNRKDFLQTIGLGATAFLVNSSPLAAGNSLSGKLAVNYSSDLSENIIDPIVPFKFYGNRKQFMLRQLIKMREEYGLRRFLLTGPNEEVRLSGFPSPDIYTSIGNQILEVKNELAKHDIEIGWWCAPTFRMGGGAPFQYITGIDGAVSGTTPCPLDKGFQHTFSEYITTVIKIANPSIIQFEDDYELSWQPPVSFGCFCPLHLSEFALMENKKYSREELLEIFRTVTPESVRLRRRWADLSRKSLVEFAKKVRSEIDEIAPDTRISLCQSGVSDFDGFFIEDVASALAGKTRPLVRLYGTNYSSFEDISIPETVFHALYSKQHLPGDFECIHESDTYPHTRFFMSSNKLKSLMTVTLSYGLDDFLLYATQYLDNPIEDKGYVKMFRDEHKRFNTIKSELQNCRLAGCEVVYKPDGHVFIPYTHGIPSPPVNDWMRVLGRFGIPYTSKEGHVKVVSGNIAKTLSEAEIENLLKGGLLLDAFAANILFEKGWGKYLGVDIRPRNQLSFCYEGIRKQKIENIEGDLMYNFAFAPAGNEGSLFYELSPLSAETEVITDFLDQNEKPVIPGLVRFKNSLGGRVAIIAYDLRGNRSSSVFNYKKKELIKQTIEWLGNTPLPIFVKDNPNAFCAVNESINGEYTVSTVVSMCADTFDSYTLEVSPELAEAKIEVLGNSGLWEKREVIRDGRKIKFRDELHYLSPVVLKFSK